MSLDMDLTHARKIETIEARLKRLEDATGVLSDGDSDRPERENPKVRSQSDNMWAVEQINLIWGAMKANDSEFERIESRLERLEGSTQTLSDEIVSLDRNLAVVIEQWHEQRKADMKMLSAAIETLDDRTSDGLEESYIPVPITE